MMSENEWIGERLKLYALMQQQPDWSLRQYARELNHDLGWVRKWVERLQATARLTLDTFKSRSRAPHHPPARIADEAKHIIGDLRCELSAQFHRRAGAKTILYGLQQYPATHPGSPRLPRASSTITRILHELGYIAPPRPVWPEPLDLPAPMTEWELDFGAICLGDASVFEFFIVVDRGTSRLVYLEGGAGYTAETALEAVARLMQTCGLPQRLRFDRDVRLWGAWTRDSYPSPLVRWLRVLGVEPVICPPHRPDLKPFVERCIGTLKHEWLDRHAPTSLSEARAALAQFPHYYNHQRPHQGRACRNQPPAVAFPKVPSLPRCPDRVDPDRWLTAAHARVYRRRVTSDGTFQVDRHTYSLGPAYAKQPVLVQVDAHQRCFYIRVDGQVVKQVPLQGLYGAAMDFDVYLTVMRAEARTVAAHQRRLWEQTGSML